MKSLSVITICMVALVASESNAQFVRRSASVRVGPVGVRVSSGGFLGLRRGVNLTNPAYVNSQALINPGFRRAQIAAVNSFSYTPVNSAANLRFRSTGVSYLRSAPITAAPILEHYTTRSSSLVQRVTADSGCATGVSTAGAVTPGDVNYLVAPPAALTAPAPLTGAACPCTPSTAALTAPSALTTPSYGSTGVSALTTRALVSDTSAYSGVEPARVSAFLSSRSYVTQPQRVITPYAVQSLLVQRQLVQRQVIQRQFVQNRAFIVSRLSNHRPATAAFRQRAFLGRRGLSAGRGLTVRARTGFLGRASFRVRGR